MLYFTQAQIDEIQRRLVSGAVKDTDFLRTLDLNPGDLIPIVQDGENKTITVEEFINEIIDGQFLIKVVQTTGDSTSAVMSQNAVTVELVKKIESTETGDGPAGAKNSILRKGEKTIYPKSTDSQIILTGDTTKTLRDFFDAFTGGDYSFTDIRGIRVVVTPALPAPSEDTKGKIYFTPKADPDPQSDDKYDEFITIIVNGVPMWERIGSADVDLSQYLKKSDISQATGTSTTKVMSQNAVTSAIASASSIIMVPADRDILERQPTTSDRGIIYLIPSLSDPSVYEQWVAVEAEPTIYEWMQIGSTSVDLSNYYTIAQVDALLDGKQNVIADLSTIRSNAESGASAYHLPALGIPSTDMTADVQSALNKANSALQPNDISGKMNRVLDAERGNLAIFDSAGNVEDADIKPTDLIPDIDMSRYYTKAEVEARISDLVAQVVAQIDFSGSVPAENVDSTEAVIFIDYDGTVLHSYSAAEFAELDSYPAYPSHVGLTAQGWNWDLATAKAYVANYGKLTIGMQYITDDNKTKLYITLDNQYYLSPRIYFQQDTDRGVAIDWGDGSSVETVAGVGWIEAQHWYRAEGNYVISLLPDNGATLTLGNDHSTAAIRNICTMGNYDSQTQTMEDLDYVNSLTKVELGKNVKLAYHAFQWCIHMETITVPSTCEYADILHSGTGLHCGFNFFQCRALTGFVCSESMTQIPMQNFYGCLAMKFISFASTVTNEYYTTAAVSACASLQRLEIPEGDENLSAYKVYHTFAANCTSLISARIPRVDAIDDYAFLNCTLLGNLNSVSADVRRVGTQAFKGCSLLRTIHFLPSDPPNLDNVDAFEGLPANYRIYVPAESGLVNTNPEGLAPRLVQKTHAAYYKYATALNWTNIFAAGHLYEEGTDYHEEIVDNIN